MGITTHKTVVTKFREFTKSIPFLSSINILKIKPLKRYALSVIETTLVFAFVEFFVCSSSGQSVKSDGRSSTAREQRIIKKVVKPRWFYHEIEAVK
ncbi:MAG TPA: hypothetical protein DCP92_12095 [Nitrospiraceae bacterium]|nr:hypothetical protein [Nitrospiraceae bacterium]